MDNILINLTADPAGLQPGIDGLVQMEVVDKELGEQVKKTGAIMDARNKAVSDGMTKSASSIEKLSNSFKGLDKNIVGGAYAKTLQQLQKEIEGTTDEFKQLALAVEFAKKKQTEFKPNSAEWKELQAQIAASEQLLNAFGNEEETTEKKTISLKAELRQLKQEIAAGLEASGGKMTPQIQEMIDRAGELDDSLKDINTTIANVGSDTRNLDGLISLASGGIGVFSAFQGAIALTGQQSEDFEFALVKLNGAMALLNGLQQVQNVLQKESAASQLIANAQKRIGLLVTQLETAAESKNIVVRYAAVGAQKALNAVMAASPAGILLLAIGAIAGAMLFFSSSSKKATVDLDELNRSMEDAIQRSNELRKAVTAAGNSELDNLNRLIEQRRAAGASENELLNLQVRASDKRKELAAQRISIAGDPVQFQKDLAAFEAGTKQQLDDLNQLSTDIGKLNFDIQNASTEKQQKELKKQKENLQSQFSFQKALYDDNATSINEYYSSINDAAVSSADLTKKVAEDSLKSATAFAEARALLAKQGTRDELAAQTAAVRARQVEDLANVNLTQGERVKINAAAEKQIADLRFDFEKRALEDAKRGIDSRVLKAKEGSREELDFRLQSLLSAQAIELKDKELTENKKLEIEARFAKERQELLRAFNRKVAEDTINSRISELTAQNAALELSTDGATNAQLLANKQQLIDEEAALEVISITETEKNEELRRVKIQAVYAKALADKVTLERNKQKAEIDSNAEFAKTTTDIELSKLNASIQRLTGYSKERKRLEDERHSVILSQIHREDLANQELLANKLISEEQYVEKSLELEKRHSDEAIAEKERAEARKLAVVQAAQQAAVTLLTFSFDVAKKGYATEEEKVKELYETKRITETEYNNRLKVIRRKQAQDEKAQALFTMLINQGPTLIKGFQTGGIAGIAAALTLFFSLLSTLQGTDVPQFYKGTKKAPRGYKWVGEKGPELTYDGGGYAIIPHEKSVQFAASGYADSKIAKEFNLPTPALYSNMTMPELPEYVQNISHSNSTQIDYDKLGEVIAQKLADNPQHSLHFDEDGFHLSVKKGNDQINYTNKKLNA